MICRENKPTALSPIDSLQVQDADLKHAKAVNNVLFAIANAVNTTLDLNDLYRSIHRSLASIIDVTNFFIAIVDTRERTLYFPYHVDQEDDDFSPITDFDTNTSLTGYVVLQGKPILLEADALRKRSGQGGVWGPVPLIWMGVPLIIKDTVIGVIAVQSYSDPKIFCDQDLRVLSAVSNQIALAIDRKQSYEDLSRHKDNLEKIVDERTFELKAANQKLQAEIKKREEAENAARKSREQLLTAIETLADGFVLYDENDRLVICNAKYLELYSDSADLIVPGALFEDMVRTGAERGQYVDAIGRVDEWVKERMQRHRLADQTVEQHLNDGRWVKITERKLQDGSTVGFRVDITEYKRAQEALQKASNELEIRVAERTAELRETNKSLEDEIRARKQVELELKRRNEYMTALHEMSLGMFERLDLTELLQAIVKRAANLTRIPNGFLYLVDTQANTMQLKAGCGRYSNLTGYEMGPGEGLAGRVWETGRLLKVGDYNSWKKRCPDSGFDFVHSIVGLPLRSGSGIEGVIGLSNHRRGKSIGPELITILEQFAELATIAIHNARLFGKLANELEKRTTLEKERREMEFRLHQSQKMESIGTLAGGIAHDFNNILASIIGFTELALDDVDKSTPLAANLKEVYASAIRARELVKQILTFARQSDEKLAPVQVDAIAGEVLKFIRSSIPTTIDIRQNLNSTGVVMGNPTQIHQVFLNLCTNAAHAMEDNGGVLAIELSDTTVDTNDHGGHRSLTPGRYLKIKVSDTGSGIEPDKLNSIFEPYFTTKPQGKGTGLGLSMVLGIIQSYGGQIAVHSEVGKGSVFTIHLPAATVQKAHREKPPDALACGNERILFVDDEASIARMGRQILERLGYTVVTRTGSVEALTLFRNTPHDFDLVITDMTMPRMTGDKLAAELIKIRPDIPIILCTGYNRKISDEVAKAVGIRALVYKPIVKKDLARTIRNVLNESVNRAPSDLL